MLNFDRPAYRHLVFVLTAALTNLSLPPFGIISLIPSFRGGIHFNVPKEGPDVHSRLLTKKEMKSCAGKTGPNPYLAGTQKWDSVYKNVDMLTGNYSFSVTDLDFQGGFGIPVSVQRTYSANNGDDGPFGPGWYLSADVRTTAGGLLKGKSAPIMAVPMHFKEINPNSPDPRSSAPPQQGSVLTDASGNPETVQRDVDGILTPPAWDNNVVTPIYATVSFNGSNYQIQTGNTTTTIDGTTYIYGSYGDYGSGGQYPVGNPSGTAVPSSVLKPSSVTDKQGNVTTYTYSGTYAHFQKSDGYTEEQELSSVAMPNGHHLTFTWQHITDVNGAGFDRIVSVSDNGGRTVTYSYIPVGESAAAPGAPLIAVTTPGGKTTTYGYGASLTDPATGNSSSNLLNSITDPRGLVTQIGYMESYITVLPYGANLEGALVDEIVAPSGLVTGFIYVGANNPLGQYPATVGTAPIYNVATEYVGGGVAESNIYQQVGYSGAATITSYYLQSWNMGPWPRNSYQYFEITGAPPSFWQQYQNQDRTDNVYDANSAQLLESTVKVSRNANSGAWGGEGLASFDDFSISDTNTNYNFMSNPLNQTVEQYMEAETPGIWGSMTRETSYPDTLETKEYAYWGQSKYYQQKAVVDRLSSSNQRGRISFTDYYPNTAAAGSRGMTYKTYSDPYAVFLASSLPGTDTNWQADLAIDTSGGDSYNSLTTYDSNGRATGVAKLQSTTTSPWTYVQTNTVYGGNNSTWWGEPETVTEDAGGINRLTQTLAYDSSGHATETEDAAGHIFQTNYANQDYQVSSIVETDCTPNVTLVSYTYGTGADNGQVASVTDGLSGVIDSFSYDDSPASGDGGLGQPSSVTEQWPWDTGGSQHGYNVGYQYNATGDRATTTYTTDNGTTQWRYGDYCSVGMNKGVPSRAPQTMTLLGSGSLTSEEFHYLYDGGGSLIASAFAQTPNSSYSPSGGAGYYGYVNTGGSFTYVPAATRARVVYDNGSGENLNLYYYWDTWSSGSYSSTNITGFQYAYDPVSLLKTGATFLNGNGTSWSTDHTESYGYDASLDYLTSANYGGSTETWTYDAAGNRSSDSSNPGTWSYDNLNRMIASPGSTYSNDIRGNRLSSSLSANGWDCLNRMTSFTSGGDSSATTDYTYRADGMRCLKFLGPNSTTYAYDGQMGFEDLDAGATPGVTDYAIGGRGLERLAKTASGATTVVYPIYDGHGNMVSTLSENESACSTGDQRRFDAWGNILTGSNTGDPKGRYCASLGHKQDDESGLVYMRARYYDCTTGRFLSEDTSKEGSNWLIYSNNSPVCNSDRSGNDPTPDEMAAWIAQAIADVKMSAAALSIFQTMLFIWQAWIVTGQNSFLGGTTVKSLPAKESFLLNLATAVDKQALEGTGGGSIEQQAQGEVDAYAISLEIAVWMFDEEDD